MKKIYSFFLLTVIVWSSSCSDYLEYEETDLIAGDVALATVANVESALMGSYGAVNDLMGILLNSVFSDEVRVGEFYNASTTHEWKYGQADVGIRDNYNAVNPQYQVIDRANRVLARVDVADSTRTGDNTLRKRLKGEALFLRAFAHFELYRFYAAKYDPDGLAMPYMESVSMAAQARIKTAEYFQKLNADITAAKALIPDNLTDINRANVTAANGLHARIALYSEQWADAETYATNYINALPLATIATFPDIWTDASTAELAYKIVRTSAQSRPGSLYRGTSSVVSGVTTIGTVTWTTSTKLYDSFDDDDVRKAAYFKTEPLLGTTRPTADRPGLIINKYAGGAYASATENLVNSKVMRTAEMYLIRAEARAEQSNLIGATADINTLRTNRITGYADIATFASIDAAITEILYERYKELAFEGHRFWDLKRKGKPVSRLAADAPSTDGTTLEANSFKFALPIYDTEMKANTAMVQNPGY